MPPATLLKSSAAISVSAYDFALASAASAYVSTYDLFDASVPADGVETPSSTLPPNVIAPPTPGRRLRSVVPVDGRNVEAHTVGLPALSGSSPTMPTEPYVTSPPSKSIAPPTLGRKFRFDTLAVGRNDEAHTAGLPALSGSSPTIVEVPDLSSELAESSTSAFAPTSKLPPETSKLPPETTIPPETLLKSSAAICVSVYAFASASAVSA